MEQHPISTCQCRHADTAEPAKESAKKTLRTVPSALLGVLIAFFPKCPLCWAAYMSMFGSIGLAQVPYLRWLFPVLLGFLGLHLFFLMRRSRQKGYGPFALSVVGALSVIGGRAIFPAENWLLWAGMAFILAGSLWNSFAPQRRPFIPSVQI